MTKYNYAYNDKNILFNIQSTFVDKTQQWYLRKDKITELTLADGDKNIKHWRVKNNNTDNLLGNENSYLNVGETPEHINCKMEILYNKSFDLDGFKIIPHRIESEYTLKNGMRSDIVFFNEDDSILCIIEIKVTHEKSESDINKLNELNTLVLEYDYNTKRTSYICVPPIVKETVQKYGEAAQLLKKEQSNTEQSIKDIKRKSTEEEIENEIYSDGECFEEIRTIQNRIKGFRTRHNNTAKEFYELKEQDARENTSYGITKERFDTVRKQIEGIKKTTKETKEQEFTEAERRNNQLRERIKQLKDVRERFNKDAISFDLSLTMSAWRIPKNMNDKQKIKTVLYELS